MEQDGVRSRPQAYGKDDFLWNLRRVPDRLSNGQENPGKTSAIFVVHGIGEQVWTSTAAELRSGFEDAYEEIRQWRPDKKERKKHGKQGECAADSGPKKAFDPKELPPPFIYEGYWADYDDLEKTFPEDWGAFNKREEAFFGKLWRRRALSGPATAWWYVKQLGTLLGPQSFGRNPFLWLLYIPLVVLLPLTLALGLLRYPRLVTGYLADVRLYTDPRGDVERAIAQRIDRRVGEKFLQLLGLDWDFRGLPVEDCIEAGCDRRIFKRVVWVAHSLGTVISYNVLSSLFRRAEELERSGDEEQRGNVERFRGSLARFVTLGSPLDKIAFLFGNSALMPWQEERGAVTGGFLRRILTLGGLLEENAKAPGGKGRRALLEGGESDDPKARQEEKEWWVNFYSVMDPVSGPLDDELICGDEPPWNYYIYSWKSFVPGYSHVTYWSDKRVLKFILGRVYGCDYLPHGEYREPRFPFLRTLLRKAGFVVWAGLLYGSVYALYYWREPIWEAVKKAAGKVLGS